ncbi:hypothetical protein J5N97_020432 [Dioscorea zingiberensis]|uniref:RRM domain-containing protein n=1 Tax=Dioscorea zingiberensis TaxID=325984 RepID=A0A9D5CH34_9LILI|nr:hypothetical protein J5N97_020432 [Dioscorea zingiberensis]
MERGMGIRASLDPQAEEFYPSSNFALAAPAPQFYIPYHHGAHPHPTPQAQYVAPAQLVEDGAVTRAVVLSMVPRGVSPDVVRAAMEEFGGVRAVEMGALAGEGNVTVHFYDLRSAQTAVAEIRDQHLRQQCRLGQQYGVMPGGWTAEQGGGVVYLMVGGGRGLIGGQAVWAHFTAKELDGPNQGSLTILNAGQGLSMDAVRQVFEDFGAVKEVREAAHGHGHGHGQQKVVVVEFFDTRDAARAMSELRGKQVLGMQLVIQFNKSKRRRSGVQSLPLPPRLLGKSTATNTSQSQLWSQSKGGGGADGGGGEGIALMKRTSSSGSSSITTNSNSGGMRRGKNSSSCNSSSSNCSRNNNNNNNSSSASSSSFKQQRWKNHNHGMKNEDSMFLFKELETMESSPSCRDSRTTVMIKNIPNKYSQKLLLNMLDNHCIHCNEQIGGEGEEPMSAYDFVYLPIDFNNKCNVGYGFVNLTSPEAAWRLYKAFHMQPWEVFNSRKICQVTYARLQGLEALKEHFKSSKFACDDDEYMPVSFSPPRDGKQLTDPTPIGSRSVGIQQTRANAAAAAAASCRGNSSSTTTKASSSADDEECPDTATMLSEALLDLSSITQD